MNLSFPAQACLAFAALNAFPRIYTTHKNALLERKRADFEEILRHYELRALLERRDGRRGYQRLFFGGPRRTSELSSSVTSTSIRLVFGRIDCARRVLEARPKGLVHTVQ